MGGESISVGPHITELSWNSLIDVPPGFVDGIDDVNDADSDPTNELQNWSNLPGIPADIADGDDVGNDTLANLNCTTDQIAKFDGINWICEDKGILVSGFYRNQDSGTNPPGTHRVYCDPGDFAVGGGFSGFTNDVLATKAHPAIGDNPDHFIVEFIGGNTQTGWAVYVTCADVTEPFR